MTKLTVTCLIASCLGSACTAELPPTTHDVEARAEALQASAAAGAAAPADHIDPFTSPHWAGPTSDDKEWAGPTAEKPDWAGPTSSDD